jgi:hypothetical protein
VVLEVGEEVSKVRCQRFVVARQVGDGFLERELLADPGE